MVDWYARTGPFRHSFFLSNLSNGYYLCAHCDLLGSCIPSRDIPNYLELYKNGGLPVEKLISHRISLTQINEGFESMAKGEGVRQVILFE